jgi:membrane-bound lytic murein transglycosylase B
MVVAAPEQQHGQQDQQQGEQDGTGEEAPPVPPLDHPHDLAVADGPCDHLVVLTGAVAGDSHAEQQEGGQRTGHDPDPHSSVHLGLLFGSSVHLEPTGPTIGASCERDVEAVRSSPSSAHPRGGPVPNHSRIANDEQCWSGQMRLRRKATPTPPDPIAGPASEEQGADEQLESALSAAARNFVGVTDQAENFDDDAPGPTEAAAEQSDASDPVDDAPPAQSSEAGSPAHASAVAPPAKPSAATGPASGPKRRRSVRRVLPAALVVAAVAVPGSGIAGRISGVMWAEQAGTESSPALGEGGFLPIQDEAPIDDYLDPGLLEAVPVGPEPVAEPIRDVLSSSQVIQTLGASGIPAVAVDAYNGAADRLAADNPDCGIRWSLLAAIGRVESNHGRFGGAELRADGYGTRPIRGIPLDGRPNVALIRDTDDGALDGDTTFDRAVGPMQFIPSTWQSVGVDANDDGRRDPNNIFDATRGAAGYLCDGGGDLTDIGDQARAVRRYNNADEYVRVVLSLARMYDTGQVTPLPSLPSFPGPLPLPSPSPQPDPGPDPGPEPEVDPVPVPIPVPAKPRTTVPSRPTRTTTTVAPTTTVPPTTTTSTTSTTVPPTPSTTAPPTTEPTTPDTTVPPTEPMPTEEPLAAVGWAPAMREVVVEIIEDQQASDAPASTTSTVPPAPASVSCEPPQAASPEPPGGCIGPEAAAGQAPPAQ